MSYVADVAVRRARGAGGGEKKIQQNTHTHRIENCAGIYAPIWLSQPEAMRAPSPAPCVTPHPGGSSRVARGFATRVPRQASLVDPIVILNAFTFMHR